MKKLTLIKIFKKFIKIIFKKINFSKKMMSKNIIIFKNKFKNKKILKEK